ncbi:MAG: DUF4862 family protein [Elusimicrobia bacterium]|nr:DUF4862 family protein [Elusimicrobiota bacterium]
MKIHVGAYAASSGLDEAAEAALYEGLADMDLAGLEQPFFGSLHRRDEGWLIGQIRPEWSLVLTTLPGTMDRLAGDRRFGLASADSDARSRAVDYVESARRAVEKLNAALGRRAVRAVMVHSAPRLDGSRAKRSLDGFAEALTDLRERDWQGASLLVEHCDAAVPGLEPDKGFLSVEDDVLAAKLSGGRTPVAVAINWGRSAVETRSAEGPLEHIARAVQADLLGALFFSGAAPAHPEYGAWRDSHVPFSTTVPESLLTPAAARAALSAAPGCPIIGLKLQTKPASLTVPQRLAVIQDGLNALR